MWGIWCFKAFWILNHVLPSLIFILCVVSCLLHPVSALCHVVQWSLITWQICDYVTELWCIAEKLQILLSHAITPNQPMAKEDFIDPHWRPLHLFLWLLDGRNDFSIVSFVSQMLITLRNVNWYRLTYGNYAMIVLGNGLVTCRHQADSWLIVDSLSIRPLGINFENKFESEYKSFSSREIDEKILAVKQY